MNTKSSEPRAIGADDRDLEPGQQVGEYVIEAKLGQGGFGTVFKAQHPLIGKVVAIKVLKRQYSAQPEMVSRFVAEARSVNQIRNRYIIDIFGFGQLEDGRHYYVMEYLDGLPLDDFLGQRGRLTIEEAIPILRAVGRALDAAHAKGIAHRDLKPENIFLATESDGTLYPKLLDFGIAKLLVADDQAKHKTRTGAPIGTPYYMSPEQCRGKDVDHRTDIYAFGCVTYKLLAGVVPFDGEDYMSILMRQMSDPVPSVAQLAPEIPASVDQAIAWMMAKDPAQRPPSVIAAVRALEDAAVAAGIPIPAATSSMGSVSAQRTPSALSPVGSGQTPSQRTPVDSLGAAATMHATGATPAPAVTPGVTANRPAPKRRVWAFVAMTAGPLVAGALVFAAIQNKQDGNGDGAGAGPRATETAAAVGGAAPPTSAVPQTVAPPDKGAPPDPPRREVSVTIGGLPPGTAVIDPDGNPLTTTASGGDTQVMLPYGTAEVRLGLTHPDKGDGYVIVRPDASVAVTAPALKPAAAKLVEVEKLAKKRKANGGTRKRETEKKQVVGEEGPEGTDALERPPEFKQ